uniref:Putative secreted protein n=1 Tax=Ixodes ricinus TaxID=34613 RepID=A0A6B0V3Z3_IXORI
MGLRLFFRLHVVAFFVVFVEVLLVGALFVLRAVFRVDILRGSAGDVGRRGRGVERVVGVVSLAVDPGALQRSRVSAVAPQLEVVFLGVREQFLFVAESLVHVAGVPLSRPVGGQDPPLLGERHHRRGHWRGHRCGWRSGLGARRGRSLDCRLAGSVPQPPGGPVAAQGLRGGRPLPESGPPRVHRQAAASQALTAQLGNLDAGVPLTGTEESHGAAQRGGAARVWVDQQSQQ